MLALDESSVHDDLDSDQYGGYCKSVRDRSMTPGHDAQLLFRIDQQNRLLRMSRLHFCRIGIDALFHRVGQHLQ